MVRNNIFRGASYKVNEITSLLKALSIYSDHLGVAISSMSDAITPEHIGFVKHIIKDLMEFENSMVQELCSRSRESRETEQKVVNEIVG